MAIQYKPTKQKKEKSPKVAKAPKAPKAEKPVKIGSATKVKTTKPAKAPKQPKAPKPEKAKAFAPTFKGGKVKKAADLEKGNVLKKQVNPIVAGSIMLAMIVVAIVVIVFVLPAAEDLGEGVKKITISQLPEKTNYLQGEQADYTGLRVTVIKHNGDTFAIRATECEITGFDSNYPTDAQTITVGYGGCTDTFTVKVIAHEKPAPVLKAIWLDPMPKTEYKVGEWLNTSGAVMVREYQDGTTVRVNLRNLDVYGWEKVNGPGTYILTVKYAENSVLCTFDYEITVTE